MFISDSYSPQYVTTMDDEYQSFILRTFSVKTVYVVLYFFALSFMVIVIILSISLLIDLFTVNGMT